MRDLAGKIPVTAEAGSLYKTIFDALSHELRTPITAICGASSQLADRMKSESDPQLKTLAADILVAARRLNRTVTNLLDMSRLEAGTLQVQSDWCDIIDIFNDIHERMSDEWRQSTLQIEIDENFPMVKIDHGLINQAFSNIVINALQHSPPHGKVIIKAGVRNNVPVITFDDEGPGFAPESIPRLFESFFRASQSTHPGIGLGLSIAKRFVELNGGTITASNRIEGGARMTVSLSHLKKKISKASL